MSQLPQIPVVLLANAAIKPIIFSGPDGAMGGGNAFTVALLARLEGTLTDVSQKVNIASNTDGSSKGWEVYRDAGDDAISVTVYNAGGAATVKTGSLRGRGKHLVCLVFTVNNDTINLFVNGSLVSTGSTNGGDPVDPSSGALTLGDVNNPGFREWSYAAIAYKDASYSDNSVGAIVEAALAFGMLQPFGVSISFSDDLNSIWDYVFDSKDLVDPTKPGGQGNIISNSDVLITTPFALSSWPSAFAKTALQPGETPAPNADAVLVASAPISGSTNALLFQSSLVWMQLDAPVAPS